MADEINLLFINLLFIIYWHEKHVNSDFGVWPSYIDTTYIMHVCVCVYMYYIYICMYI